MLVAVAKNKELVVNTIENLQQFVPIEKAVKAFNISRATYQNYKPRCAKSPDFERYAHSKVSITLFTPSNHHKYTFFKNPNAYIVSPGTSFMTRCAKSPDFEFPFSLYNSSESL